MIVVAGLTHLVWPSPTQPSCNAPVVEVNTVGHPEKFAAY